MLGVSVSPIVGEGLLTVFTCSLDKLISALLFLKICFHLDLQGDRDRVRVIQLRHAASAISRGQPGLSASPGNLLH
jgi:hypothetical protein